MLLSHGDAPMLRRHICCLLASGKTHSKELRTEQSVWAGLATGQARLTSEILGATENTY
jgi:hypothetical protein|eukprot:COSAG01_NODE_2313_length_7933_cov_79.874777_2_plen_59_part_00